jgi:hypothetical protein
LSKLLAMGEPMLPKPINAMFMDLWMREERWGIQRFAVYRERLMAEG